MKWLADEDMLIYTDSASFPQKKKHNKVKLYEMFGRNQEYTYMHLVITENQQASHNREITLQKMLIINIADVIRRHYSS